MCGGEIVIKIELHECELFHCKRGVARDGQVLHTCLSLLKMTRLWGHKMDAKREDYVETFTDPPFLKPLLKYVDWASPLLHFQS